MNPTIDQITDAAADTGTGETWIETGPIALRHGRVPDILVHMFDDRETSPAPAGPAKVGWWLEGVNPADYDRYQMYLEDKPGSGYSLEGACAASRWLVERAAKSLSGHKRTARVTGWNPDGDNRWVPVFALEYHQMTVHYAVRGIEPDTFDYITSDQADQMLREAADKDGMVTVPQASNAVRHIPARQILGLVHHVHELRGPVNEDGLREIAEAKAR